jgi:hypothetical protein
MNRERCEDCNRIAVWSYMPGEENFCDIHVPRGCSCNMEPIDGDYENLEESNWEEKLDDQGRKYPCCEYSYTPLN